MNWASIGKLVAGFAPVLGTLLGGPLGGILGTALGGILGLSGSSLTPDNVAAIIQKGGDVVIAQIQAYEQQVAAEYGYLTAGVQADATQGQAINETIRAEIAGGVSWWHWRNLLGYAVLSQVSAPMPLLIWFLYRGDSRGVGEIATLLTNFSSYFFLEVGLLGYVAADTTRRITTAIVGNHAPTIVDLIGKLIGKKQ